MLDKLLVSGVLIWCIVMANWLTSEFGLVPAGFGLMVTAGTYAAGLALGVRDWLQDTAGTWWVFGAIAVGGVVSYWLADPVIALASAAAFTVSELCDMAIYTPLRGKTWPGAVALSNLVGAIVDTIIFIGIAGSVLGTTIWAAMPGQLVGKGWATLAFVLVMGGWRAVSVRRRTV
jgi:hypothetical protein